jgi:hypothetical protein
VGCRERGREGEVFPHPFQLRPLTPAPGEFFHELHAAGCLLPPNGYQRTISRNFLDNMTIEDVIEKVSGYYRKIHRNFLDIILYWVNIRKLSVFCPIGVDKTESFGIISSCAIRS